MYVNMNIGMVEVCDLLNMYRGKYYLDYQNVSKLLLR